MLAEVLQAAGEGLTLVFGWPNILYPVAGTLLAMTFALMPGISGITLIALALPFTFAWEPLEIMLFFGPLIGSGTFAGSITAILFNIPGSAPNAATVIDGYPLAQRGEAKTALACAAAASALGSTFGILILILLIPLLRATILLFGAPEFLMLAVWGLSTIAVLARGSLVKGLAAAGIGLLLAFVGTDPRSAELRFTFGSLYLRDGVSTTAVFLGIFALAEIFDLVLTGRTTISDRVHPDRLTGSVRRGLASVFRHFGLFLRCSVLGTVIGMIPGIGGTVASFVAYGHATQSCRDPQATFGRGDIRGVLAPEAANDAKDGGSLVPVLALGIPGSASTALLIAALTLHGIVPGQALMTEQLPLVFVLIWALFLSNWLTSLAGLAVAQPLARLTVVPVRVLVPLLLGLTTAGAFLTRGRIADLGVAFVFGLLGLAMKRHGWPRVPFLVALVLAPLFEVNLHLTWRLQQLGRINVWTRPIAVGLLLLTLGSLLLPWVQAWHRRRRGAG